MKYVAIWSALTVAAALFIDPMFVMIFWGQMGAALMVYLGATGIDKLVVACGYDLKSFHQNIQYTCILAFILAWVVVFAGSL